MQDKIILYFICLDALYMTERMELGYRLSQRVALMLGQSQSDRKAIFDKIKALYKKRGAIVHGAPTQLSPEEIDVLRDCVNRSIARFLDLKALGKNKEDILDLLDVSWQSGKSIDELLKG